MAQRLVQTEEQRQQQVQRLSAQHMLVVKLIEMPLAELEESVQTELNDNPALEEALPDEQNDELGEEINASDDESGESDLDNALSDLNDEDYVERYNADSGINADDEEMVYGNTISFYDRLKEQLGETDLSDDDRNVVEYLIGSLDDDGLLRKDLRAISDELAVYYNIDKSVDELEQLLRLLQTFDPPGIGARSLQECLLIQTDRLLQESDDKQPEQRHTLELMHKLFENYYDDFTRKHWHKIRTALRLSDADEERLRKAIRRLNPKPGASLGETEGRNLQQITPDFVVETLEDGRVTFYLNQRNIPPLTVSPTFMQMVDEYKNNKDQLSKRKKEELLYVKEKVDKAKGFIEAVRQRRETMTAIMKTIIEWQISFFQDGEEADLRPMILEDIAKKTGYDKSTVSRVCSSKYAQTRWGIFPLRFFFSERYTTDQGEELSTRKIKLALKDLISHEDKKSPMSDEELAAALKAKKLPISRRTVAKYRQQMDIPVARLRKN